jgi:predicted DNA-binding transcriptional regulator AlpA
MLNRLPRMMPPLPMMLDDIGNPKPRDLARALGVSERTMQRWVAKDNAPVPVQLAIFWLTRWGQSAVNAEAQNISALNASMVRCLRHEIVELKATLGRLGRIADFGAANDPAPNVPTPQPGTPDQLSNATAGKAGSTAPTTQQPCGFAADQRVKP